MFSQCTNEEELSWELSVNVKAECDIRKSHCVCVCVSFL